MTPNTQRTQSPWPRRATQPVRVGDVLIGAGAPVTVQTMTKTDTHDVAATLAQVRSSAEAGAELVRIAVPDREAVEAFAQIREKSPVPLVADVHFDYRLAVQAAQVGADKLRINPGNIGGRERLAAVVEAAGAADIPIRIGVNAGSLEKDILERDGRPTAAGLAESALRSVQSVRELGLDKLVVSIKAAEVPLMVAANRAFAGQCDLPLHLGVTEAGFGRAAAIKAAAGLSILLSEGIGDTIRVSMTDPPEQEVEVGDQILRSLGLREGPWLISSPTCGRCQVDLPPLARRVEKALRELGAPLTVAVMGCEVNGPGEARQADVGLAAGRGRAVIFARGEKLTTVPIEQAVDVLIEHMTRLATEAGKQPDEV